MDIVALSKLWRKADCYGKYIGKEFFWERPDFVARSLLGSIIIKNNICIIIETEAYFGECDPGSRASKYRKGRIRAMLYGQPGKYLVYGMHGWLLTNIVAHKNGMGGAVLIRSCYSPSNGVIEGPGKVSRFLGVTMDDDGKIVGSNNSPAIICGFQISNIRRLYRVNVKVDFEEPMRFSDARVFNPRPYRPRRTVRFTLC